jgi:hypothetical protein
MPLLCGCSQLNWNVFTPTDDSVSHSIPNQERHFAGALEFLRSGNEQAARDQFERVVKGPSRIGITDEALFRLSVLYLRDDGSKGTVRALELLERLKHEFPRSIWTRQAAPLVVYLAGTKTLRELRHEVNSLKELNLTLNRENRDLRQSMERLKSLDLELEQKIKR